MKIRKIFTIMMVSALLASLPGCGKKDAGSQATSAEVSAKQAEASDKRAAQDAASKESRAAGENAEYEEQEYVFVLKEIDQGDGTEIDISQREWVSGPFTISGSVDIYSPYGTKCGYTKPDITVDGVNKLGEWLYVPFQKTSFLVKAEDLGKFVAKTDQKQNTGTYEEGGAACAAPAILDMESLSVSIMTPAMPNIKPPIFHVVDKTVFIIDTAAVFPLQVACEGFRLSDSLHTAVALNIPDELVDAL